MRLLEILPSGSFCLTRKSLDDTIPQYAVLSHTWGDESQEVTFKDMVEGLGRGKAGYEKIKFCGDQAARDGLRYFWVDSCCIKKSSNAELSESLNSMFRWYQRAEKCYVFLSDVSTSKRERGDENVLNTWEQAFRKSRWFARGWTLQELLAPTSVEFFSKEGSRLGDKQSLAQQIHEITGIPISALPGSALSQFSVNERLSWTEHRQTKLEEDKAYSLLGVFDVYIPPIYGEGTGRAFERLMDEIDKLEKCIRDLRLTDPRDDKKRIEDIKGGLLEGSYRWILENSDFQQWRRAQQSRLLWIKGDPGKGKTMLLCGVINELNKSMANIELLSYFFCQATDSRLNNATAVLRGLVYLVIIQQPSLVSHIRKKHDHAGKSLFEDANAWVALCEIFTNILQDPSLESTYLIIDTLDECVSDLPKLLDFIVQKSSISPRVKWLVSSRNWPDIEEWFERTEQKVRLCLELNVESVSTAVTIYIQHRVLQLVKQKKYNDKTWDAVYNHLSSNANNTFLWVALVCQNLERTPQWNTLAKLKVFPPGLDSLYKRMLERICDSDNADLCKRILASTAVVYRPITLHELTSLVDMLDVLSDDLKSLTEIIGLCGSFLTIREGTIYFVHQSAKEYLFTQAFHDIFPSRSEEAHYVIFSRSLQVISKTLRRDIYGLHALGSPIEKVNPPNPDPLAASRYSCIYWVDHLCDWNSCADHAVDLQDGGMVDVFLRKKFLYWLEALSLCKSMLKGVLAMARLEALIEGRGDALALLELVRDARRFIMYHKQAIENSPLQAYVSAVVFSPAPRLTRCLFKEEELIWINIKPAMGDKWNACLQTLEGHSHFVNSVAFSYDSTRLASASEDRTIRIWDTGSGECVQVFEGHSQSVSSVAFSHDSNRLASASRDRTIRIWDTSSGECVQMFEGHSQSVSSVAFSHDSTQLASASRDRTIRIWDTSSGKYIQTFKGHSDVVSSVAFSHNSTRLASASWDHTIRIWDTGSSECVQTLKGHSEVVNLVAFSHDSTRLASASWDHTIRIWDTGSGKCVQTLKGHSQSVNSVAFSNNSTWLASASWDHTIRIWDTGSGECIQTLEGHSDAINSVTFSHDSTWLASASWDHTIRIWDTSSGECIQTFEGHSDAINSVTFSHDSTWLASASWGHIIRIWDTSSGKCVQTLEGHSHFVSSVAFSHDSTRLASASRDRTIKIWDTGSGECVQTLEGHSDAVSSVAFSHDSTQLASASWDRTIKIWDTNSSECVQTLSIGIVLYDISFDITGSYLHTDIGTVAVDAPPASNMTPNKIERQNPRHLGVGLSPNGEWITCNSENLVWLPSEYRPSRLAVSGRTIGIGVGSGKVWMCNLKVTNIRHC